MDIERVAVVGAGLMGHGIAQVFAHSGCSVMLYDINENILSCAMERISSNLKLYVEIGDEDDSSVNTIISRIKTTTNLQDAVKKAQFITEAVPEDMDLKKELFKKLDTITGKDVILASNTSMLSITEITRFLKKADRSIITHWFNPPHLVPVVEVVLGQFTSDETSKATIEFLIKMGKEPVRVLKELPGFLVNRIQTAMFREVLALLEAGVASPEDIDKAVRGSFGVRLPIIGPLATADLGGLDLWCKGAKRLFPLLDSSKEPKKILTDKVEKGFLGYKSQKGFFDYHVDSMREREAQARDMKIINILKMLYPKKG